MKADSASIAPRQLLKADGVAPAHAPDVPPAPAVQSTYAAAGSSQPEIPVQALRQFDQMAGALVSRVTGGISPAAVGLAFADWAIHLGASPGKQWALLAEAWQAAGEMARDTACSLADSEAPCSIEAPATDRRFSDERWQAQPYRSCYQGFLQVQRWWQSATHDVAGVSHHHEDVVGFTTRQWLDVVSPSNLPWANPDVVAQSVATGGRNFFNGIANWWEDFQRLAGGQPPVGVESFRPGHEVAITPGKVIYRNHLIELIQYAPSTPDVHAEPILIVPAWIMKYYILDLSPGNSLVRYLVDKGHTVFCISWRNVTEEDRDIGLDDYRRLGIMAALDQIGTLTPGRRVHAVGYCLGGTLLALTAAAMANAGDERLATVSLFAAQTDFTEPGELQLFIDDSQVAFLESMMWARGCLTAAQMAGAFQMLHSNDLIWSRVIHEYLMGERPAMNDLMAWNADATRMPYRMHSEYLRRMFLNNDLASGRYQVDGRPIAIQNIRAPIFAVGTETDHVAPWRSVYKIHYLSDTDVTFALTSGGHNAGIVSEPGHPHRHFRLLSTGDRQTQLSPDEWTAAAPLHEGSWWPVWQSWLESHSSTQRVQPPPMGPALSDAPGTYVLQP